MTSQSFDRLAVLAYECVDSAMDMADARPRTKEWRALTDEVVRLLAAGVDFDAMRDADQIVAACRVCGCTDDDCSGCIDRTGEPCHWVESDLCSACVGAPEGEEATP